MNVHFIRACALPIALVTFLASAPASAIEVKNEASGAMPGDKTMTCQDVLAERTSINDAVLASAAKSEQARKTKKRLFGFAKSLATIAVPGAALLAGGPSSFGSLATQQAGQAALDAVGTGSAAATPAVAKPSDAQQARLTRLDAIAAYRECAA